MLKKKLPWMALFLVIAAATVWAVASQSRSFSFLVLLQDLKRANMMWLLMAVAGMVGIIFFEGMALRSLILGIAGKKQGNRGTVYAAADIYFSAITPSATGGQPASAYFMIEDGIPAAEATVILLTNLILYTLALFAVGVVACVLRPGLFLLLDGVSHVLLIIGFVILAALVVFFALLLKRVELIEKITKAIIHLGKKLHLLRNAEKQERKLNAQLQRYRACASAISGKKKMLVQAFVWNLLQRLSQTSVIVMVYLALRGEVRHVLDVWAVQVMTNVASNSVPIPGAMGIADYLLIQGLEVIPNIVLEANLEMISRSISFYFCVLISLIITVIAILRQNRAVNHK